MAMEQLSMLMIPNHDVLKDDFVIDELARAILMDFLQDQESLFQPIYIGAAQYEKFYFERDHLTAIALKTGSISELLKLAGIQNIPLFRKRLHQLYNMNIREFITEIRMSSAMKMLTDPTISIKEIAVKTGFASAFYFSRVFTNYFGLPPKSFHAKKYL
jgi:AraC-like DNA-binding protein